MSHLLEVFLKKLVKSPIKQTTSSEAIYSATRPRSLMPLQFGLAVAVDNHLASEWWNNLLYKLGFAASYDEVRTLQNKYLKKILKVLVIFSAGGDYFPIKNDTSNIANHFHTRFVSTCLLSYKMFEWSCCTWRNAAWLNLTEIVLLLLLLLLLLLSLLLSFIIIITDLFIVDNLR